MAVSTSVNWRTRPRSEGWGQSTLELILRVSGAVLHITATWVVLTGLSPEAAGVYYKGVVVALALGTLLRKKYELFLAPYIASNLATSCGIPVGKLVYSLSKRLLIRACLICSVLLVFTTDLDILEPHLRPYLQTFLPFVISVPFVSLSVMLSVLLRAANRPALGVLAATVASNLAVIGVGLCGAEYASLEVYSWAYLAGSLASAGLAAVFVRNALRGREEPMTADCSVWTEVHRTVSSNTSACIAQTLVLWGPLCVLALLASPAEFASVSAAVRSSQILDFLLPGLSFIACTETAIFPWMRRQCTDRSAFLAVLLGSIVGSTVIVLALLAAGPVLFGLYGDPYSGHLGLFTIMLGAQWMSGVGRPAARFLSEHWQPQTIRRILEIAALGGMAVCVVGISSYGALAAVSGLFVGWMLLTGLMTATVMSRLGVSAGNIGLR